MKRKILTTSLLLSAVVMFTGCSSTQAPYTDENFDVLQQDLTSTVCSVSGKTVMTQEDVDSFQELSERLDAYEGEKKEQVKRVSDSLYNISLTWEGTLGIDLGEQNGEQLTNLCNQLEQAYDGNS